MRRLVAIVLALGCASAPQRREPGVDEADLRILERASAILLDEARWNRQDDRDCPPRARSWSLFCALHDASIEVLGEYQHRRAALEEVRLAVEEASPGREFQHRLMDFNNLPETSFVDIHRVLARATARVRERLGARSR